MPKLFLLLFAAIMAGYGAGVANADTYKFSQDPFSDTTQHRWAVITGKYPIYNRGQVTHTENCTLVETPIYSNSEGELLGTLFGMLLGGAIGNKAGGGEGAVAGALLGGVAGNSVSKDNTHERRIIGYRKRKHCTQTPVRNQGDFQVIGWVYTMKDWTGNFPLPSIGSERKPSQKQYVVGQKIPYRGSFAYGNN